jgi:menaquinone-dependent protoporphyrinogen oxidase
MKVLLAYASVHGATEEVARFMGELLRQHGKEVRIASVEQVETVEGFDAAILGTAIHGGMWLSKMAHFINEHRKNLKPLPLYAWATCIRVLEEGGYEHAMEHYMRKSLPTTLTFRDYNIFAGRIRREDVDLSDRWTLSVRYDGRINTSYLSGDYRDWQKITAWTLKVADDLTKAHMP